MESLLKKSLYFHETSGQATLLIYDLLPNLGRDEGLGSRWVGSFPRRAAVCIWAGTGVT